MKVKLEKIKSIDDLKTDLDNILSIVEEEGKIIVIDDNKPKYIIYKYDYFETVFDAKDNKNFDMTLQKAMEVVLKENESKILHVSVIADIIYENKLYLMKDGRKAKYTQIRARASNYPDIFEALPGNHIRLIKKD